jgi:CRP-like cAMP-binding protein
MKQDLNNTDIPSTSPPFNAELAFPFLTEEMITRLQGYGHKDIFDAGVPLWGRGEREVDMFVVLEGMVDVYAQGENGERKVVATLHEKQFSGELDLLSSRQTLVNGCTATACALLRIPRNELQRLLRSEGDIANLILQATIWRRLGIVARSSASIILLGHSTAADTMLLQRFLTRNNYLHQLLEPTAEQFAHAEPETSSSDEYLLPAVIFADGKILHRPTLAAITVGLLPIAGADEAGPIPGMGAFAFGTAFGEQGARGIPYRVRRGGVMAEALIVELVHELTRRLIIDRPQGHDDGVGSGYAEGALKAEDAFSVAEFAVAGVAGGENCPIDSAEIERGDLLRGEDGLRRAVVAAGEDQSGVKQRIAVPAGLIEQECVGGNVENAAVR